MLAGLIGPPDDDDDEPVAPTMPRQRRRRRSSSGSGSSLSGTHARRSRPEDGNDSPVPASDAGTDETNSEGEEKAAKGGVKHPLRNPAEFRTAFKGKAIHQAVVEVACRLARLMGKICGDNEAARKGWTEAAAQEVQNESKLFVTRFVRVLFGAVSTTKMHRLGFHLMEELLQRGNFEEADTSVNEMLHKLLKAMYRVTNKHPDNFQVQMMKCEQTLLHILAEDADKKLRDAEQSDAVAENNAARRSRRKTGRRPSGVARGGEVYGRNSTSGGDLDDLGYDASDESEHHVGYVNDGGQGGRSAHGDGLTSFYLSGASGADAGDVHPPPNISAEESDTGNSDANLRHKTGRRYGGTSMGSSSGVCSAHSSSSDGQSDGCDGSGSDESGSVCSGGSTATSGSSNSTTSSDRGSKLFPTFGDNEVWPGSGAVELLHACRRGRKRAARPLMAGASRLVKRPRAARNPGTDDPARRKGVRIRGTRISVAAAAAADGGRLMGLPETLGLLETQVLTVGNSMAFNASFEWGADGFVQRVRAAHSLYNGSPWWDHVLFTDDTHPAARPRLGLARLLIRAVDGERRDLVIVQLLEEANARRDCVLTEFGCGRRRWKMDARTGFPALAAVPVENLRRLEHVVPDFEDLCDRLGLYATPATVPDSTQELPLQRFFVNAFFPWTGGCQDEAS